MVAPAVLENGRAAPTEGRISILILLFRVRGVASDILIFPCFWPLRVGSGASLADGSVQVNVVVLSVDE